MNCCIGWSEVKLAVLCIAAGNSLRGDDGAAHRVLQLLMPSSGAKLRAVQQLTPELAAEIAGMQTVIFLDADCAAAEPRVERVGLSAPGGTPLAHGMAPAEVVRLAERLYGFRGTAFVCHLPAADFDGGETLSPRAEAGARAAAGMIEVICRDFQVL